MYILYCYYSTPTLLIHATDKISQSADQQFGLVHLACVVVKTMHVLNTRLFAVNPTFISGIDMFQLAPCLSIIETYAPKHLSQTSLNKAPCGNMHCVGGKGECQDVFCLPPCSEIHGKSEELTVVPILLLTQKVPV